MEVSTARLLGAALLLLGLLAAAAVAAAAGLAHPVAEADRVRRRYGDRILPVMPVALIAGRPVEDVPDVDSLVKLAERHGLLVLTWSRGGIDTYVVQDESTTYRYRSGTVVEPVPAAEQDLLTAGARLTLRPTTTKSQRLSAAVAVTGRPVTHQLEPAEATARQLREAEAVTLSAVTDRSDISKMDTAPRRRQVIARTRDDEDSPGHEPRHQGSSPGCAACKPRNIRSCRKPLCCQRAVVACATVGVGEELPPRLDQPR